MNLGGQSHYPVAEKRSGQSRSIRRRDVYRASDDVLTHNKKRTFLIYDFIRVPPTRENHKLPFSLYQTLK